MEKLNLKLSPFESQDKLFEKACKKLNISKGEIKHFKILKKSIDARNKSNVFYNYVVEISNKEEVVFPCEYKRISKKQSVLVVGAGPSGLFCALELLRHGFEVCLIERGKCVEERQKSVDDFIKNRILDENSNVQFGEGGAGTFSDGKLNTSNGGEEIKQVLQEFVNFGAENEILYLNKPHLGSDKLPKIVKNIRQEILKLGGKVLFNTCLNDFVIENGRIKSVLLNDKKYVFDKVVLAVGHSARDVYDLAYQKGVFMEAKDFAVGLRIEHLQKDVNLSQYGEKYAKILPPADYKLVSHYLDRGIFTFCMCPGGYVVPSSSNKNTIVVNGMSNFSRNGENSNSAVICQVKKEDFGGKLFGGVEFQRDLEVKAFLLGGEDYKAPCQLVKDYFLNTSSNEFSNIKPTYSIGVKKANLNLLFSEKINDCLKFAIKDMGKKLKGFDNPYALLTGVESRTSSPIRIVRNENYRSVNVENLYPCGEGCGYAGGIMSACVDGKRVAKSIFKECE